MKKEYFKLMFRLFLLLMPMLGSAQVSSGDETPLFTLSIQKNDVIKNLANKKLTLFLNETDFRAKYSRRLKGFNDPFKEVENSSPSALYEFNLTNNIHIQLLPFVDFKDQNNHYLPGQNLNNQFLLTLININFN